MFGRIEGIQFGMLFNNILVKKDTIHINNTVTGERMQVRRKVSPLVYNHTLRTLHGSLKAYGGVKLGIDYIQPVNGVEPLVYRRGRMQKGISLASYLKTAHTYGILPDRVEEILDITAYKTTGVLLRGYTNNYILREQEDVIRNIQVVNQLQKLKDELFLQLRKSDMIDVQSILDIANKDSEETGGVFRCYMQVNEDTDAETQIELRNMFNI